MQLLTTESLEKLRSECQANPQLALKPLDDLTDQFNLTFIPYKHENIKLLELRMPDGHTQETNKDLENCKIIIDTLSDLTAADATDERLWASLCFGEYAAYTQARWPLQRAKTVENHVQDHWFARTNRNRMRDNAIARLWWMAHIAQKVPNSSYEDVLKTLFFNSDYRSSLLERNSSANAINVLVSILTISQEAFSNGIEFKRDKFRNFMKQVDLVGKRTSLPSLNTDDLKALLAPLYYEAYRDKRKSQPANNKKTNGLLGRFLSSN